MSKVIASIVSFNSQNYLKNCLKDLLNQKTNSEIEIWIVDNNSSDNSVPMIKKDFPKIKLLESDKNHGFAGAQNLILSRAKGDYYLLVNPDTEIPEDAVAKMVTFMEENPGCGIAGSKIESFNGKINSNGGDLPTGLAALSWLFNLESFGIKSNFHRDDKDFYETPGNKGWVGGTFMMLRKEVIEKVGLLNTDYFMYVEDVEYCYRAKNEGFKIMINPGVTIKHKSGGSTENPNEFQWLNEFNNLILFYKNNFNLISAWGLKLMIYISLVLRIIAYTLLGKGGTSLTYAKIITKI